MPRVEASGNSQQLMRLQAHPPARMRETVGGGGGVGCACRAVHGLQEEMPEPEVLEPLRLCLGLALRIYELQFIARGEHERCAGLGADAGPVEPGRRGLSAVGLDAHLEAACM